MRIALVAHDRKKDDMVALATEFAPLLRQHTLIATGTTGGRLQTDVGLTVERLLSGPLGGDLQIGARLAVGEVDAVIFLRDPMTAQPHEPDINALVRACDVHNVPCATNVATARVETMASSPELLSSQLRARPTSIVGHHKHYQCTTTS